MADDYMQYVMCSVVVLAVIAVINTKTKNFITAATSKVVAVAVGRLQQNDGNHAPHHNHRIKILVFITATKRWLAGMLR